MTTFQNNLNVPQMTTPINSLPLKTTEYSSDELEDPLIKGVLKEFEDEYLFNQKQHEEDNYIPEVNTVLEQPPNNAVNEIIYNNSEYNNAPNNDIERLNYNNDSKDFFDMNIAKKALVLSLIFFIVFNLNIFDNLLKNVPEYFKSYVQKNGTFINMLLLFTVIYSLFKFEFI